MHALSNPIFVIPIYAVTGFFTHVDSIVEVPGLWFAPTHVGFTASYGAGRDMDSEA